MLTRNDEKLRETEVPSRRNYAPKHHPLEPVATSREDHLVMHDIWRIHAMQVARRQDMALPRML